MGKSRGIAWTNRSVLQLAGDEDPVTVVERKARALVLKAMDKGWSGPPFNPIVIADLLGIKVEANAEVPNARIMPSNGQVKIEFNPAQPRERLRFSIAHEVAHALFPDVGERVRHRQGPTTEHDEWQLEMLCNLAASEFIMPIGSLTERPELPPIEELMIERRQFDVSAEAFLIRAAKTTSEPVQMFCASPLSNEKKPPDYRIDYVVPSKTAPAFQIAGQNAPKNSIIFTCTAIGYTNRAKESWSSREELMVECVGIPAYPGSSYPRVAGLLRFDTVDARPEPFTTIHGNVLNPVGSGTKVICQLVNDQARRWGGGVARGTAQRFPDAQRQFSDWIISIPKKERLGKVHWARVGESTFVASLVGQSGFGDSLAARIRYQAIEECFREIAEFAVARHASIHMPRIGTGASGGDWMMVEEIVLDAVASKGVPITVYDPPPQRLKQAELF